MNSIDIENLLEGLCEANYDYDHVLKQLDDKKKQYVSLSQEPEANLVWIYEQIVKINQGFVEVYNLIKSEKYYDAWCEAERVEIKINSLYRNITKRVENIDFIERQIRNIQTLYPYNLFASYEAIYKRKICSICEQEISIRNQCEHIKGRIYYGQECVHVVCEAEMLNVALVKNPVHRYAVLFPSMEDNNDKGDSYNYNAVKFLDDIWSSPYMYWDLEIQKKYKPHSEFPSYPDDDICPCESGRSYKECCQQNPKGVRYNHYVILYNKK